MSAPDPRPAPCQTTLNPRGRSLIAFRLSTPFAVRSQVCPCPRVTVLSAVGRSRRNIWSEAQALQCPQRAHLEYMRPNGLPRSLPAPSPRWATPPCAGWRCEGISSGLLSRAPVAPTSGRSRPSARCCAGRRIASWPAPLGLCRCQIVWRSPVPSLSGARRA